MLSCWFRDACYIPFFFFRIFGISFVFRFVLNFFRLILLFESSRISFVFRFFLFFFRYGCLNH